jgi:SAM-dependent methyltransferase
VTLATNGADPFLARLAAAGPAGVPRASRFVVCRRCGLVRQHPRPTGAAVARLYAGDFWTRAVEVYAAQGGRMVREQFTWIARACDLRERLRRGPVRVLDIGCTTGKLLDGFRAAGCETHGIEPHAPYAEYARAAGHAVTTGLFPDAAPAGDFDVITASHVLEHAAEPAAFLGSARARLRAGGVMFLEVPSVTWPAADLWTGVFVSPHYHVYSGRTLAATCAAVGLTVERQATRRRGVRVVVAPGGAPRHPSVRPGAVLGVVALTAFHRALRCPMLRAGLAARRAVTAACQALLRRLLGSRGEAGYAAVRRWIYP